MKKIIFKILLLIILFPLYAFAQETATDPTASSTGIAPDATAPLPTSSTTSTTTNPDPLNPVGTSAAGTPTPSSTTTPIPPRPTPKIVTPISVPLPMAIDTIQNTPLIETNSGDSQNVIVVALLASGSAILLFFGLNMRKKKKEDKKNDKKCANIKKLMEEKLNELTDMKSQLTEITKNQTIEQIKEMTTGTATGKLLVFVENRKKEYEKLKELYEKCITDLGKTNYRGVIIEESLNNKKVLNKVKMLKTKTSPTTEKDKTPWVKQWTLHTFEISEEDADKIAKQLSKDLDKAHSWYADFKNENYHFIIYRGKIFKVDLKNPTLYEDAKQYGISLGIPEYQVDFASENKVLKKT